MYIEPSTGFRVALGQSISFNLVVFFHQRCFWCYLFLLLLLCRFPFVFCVFVCVCFLCVSFVCVFFCVFVFFVLFFFKFDDVVVVYLLMLSASGDISLKSTTVVFFDLKKIHLKSAHFFSLFSDRMLIWDWTQNRVLSQIRVLFHIRTMFH